MSETDSKLARQAPPPPPAPAMSPKAKRLNMMVNSLAIFTFILSLPILASIVWLFYMRDYDCEELLRLPKVQIGMAIALIFLFLVSNVAVVLKSRAPVLGFLVAMVVLIVMLTAGLALLGAYKMESRKVMASPGWLRSKVYSDRHWNYIKSCIYDTGTCSNLAKKMSNVKSYDFSIKKLSAIESGCCKPPSMCNMVFINATFWKTNPFAQQSGHSSQRPRNPDCNTWRNDASLMCYNCDSCREGFLSTIRSKWWKLGLFIVLMSLFLIVAHFLLFLTSMWARMAG